MLLAVKPWLERLAASAGLIRERGAEKLAQLSAKEKLLPLLCRHRDMLSAEQLQSLQFLVVLQNMNADS